MLIGYYDNIKQCKHSVFLKLTKTFTLKFTCTQRHSKILKCTYMYIILNYIIEKYLSFIRGIKIFFFKYFLETELTINFLILFPLPGAVIFGPRFVGLPIGQVLTGFCLLCPGFLCVGHVVEVGEQEDVGEVIG